MMIITSAILLFSVTVSLVRSLDPFCDESSFVTSDTDPQLPLLPDQFTFSIEATIAERNSTMFATEYLDEFSNRGRFDFTSGGTKVTVLSDYNLGESFVFPDRRMGRECSVNLLASNTPSPMVTRFLFGIEYRDDNTVHIGAPSFIFYNSINTSRVNYMGIEELRGIPCHRWQTCVVSSENISYTLDYYFTNSNLWGVDDWTPVSVELKGTRLNTTDNTVINIDHYYSFVDYRTGNDSVSGDVFDVPTGLICAGRLTGKPLPTLPDYFSTSIEFNRGGGLQTYTEFYDFTHQLFRIDGYIQQTNTSFIVVEDYNTQTQYYTPVGLLSGCSISPMDYDSLRFQAVRDDDGNLHLRNPKNIFFAQDYQNFVYEGVVQLGDNIEADAWIAQNTSNITVSNIKFSNPRYELYFSRPGTVISSVYGSSLNPVPLSSLFSATQTTTYPNGSVTVEDVTYDSVYYSFTSVEPPLDVYDISQCLSPDEYVQIRMRFKLDALVNSEQNLKQSIRFSLSEYAKKVGMPFLTPLQVSSLGVSVTDDQFVVVHAHISNVSSNATVKWAYTANALVNTMLQGVDDGDELPFTISIGDSVITPSYYPEEEAEISALADSSIALISIAMLVVGVLVGVVAMVLTYVIITCCCKRKSSFVEFGGGAGGSSQSESAAKYERQIDDVVADDAAD